MDKADYLDALEAESDAFLAAAAAVPLDRSVAHCGDWTMADLVVHQVGVWGFATANVLGGGEKNPPATKKPEEDGKLFEWAASVRATMIEALQGADPDAPAWSFAPTFQTAGFWQRRMVAETAIHRWDAQTTAGTAMPIAAEFAADGIDEYTQVGLRSSSGRPDRTYPSQSIHLHCTDTEGEWTIAGDGDSNFTVAREHAKGDAAVKGEASALLLWIWGRDGGPVEIFGDESVATTWRELAP
jgi:uncharacterized protein (TIGR03083 family)